jgi:hypothetical protein
MTSLHGAIFSLANTATFHASSASLGASARASERAVHTARGGFARSRAPRVGPLARALADLAALACLRSGIRSTTGTENTKD